MYHEIQHTIRLISLVLLLNIVKVHGLCILLYGLSISRPRTKACMHQLEEDNRLCSDKRGAMIWKTFDVRRL